MLKQLIVILCLACIIKNVEAQNQRSTHYNTIGWYNYFGTINLNKKFGIHTEYQWRRNQLITDWQQSLLRVGLNFSLNPHVLFRVGYGWIETFPYGDVPINSLGRDFTEHRFFQMLQLSHKEGRLDFSHRFMLEQRYLGIYVAANTAKEDKFNFLNRARYMFRAQVPLTKKDANSNGIPYFAVYNEIFIGFGKNVGVNIFDQNRLAFLMGYRFNKNIRVEAGYLHQILQFGRTIDSKNIFQNNKGIILNSYLNIQW
jgi:hypothetical protein